MGLPPGVGYRWRSCYPWKGSRDAIWVLERNFLPSLASQFLYTVPDLPCVRSTMPVSSWAPAASVLVVPHGSRQPPAPEPLRSGWGSDAACRHGLIWDHTVFHVVPNWRARPEIVAPSERNCRIAQRIARTPKRARGAHTRSSCSRNVTVWQVRSRHIQRRIVPPEPCRDPGPGRVDHLHATVALSDSAHNQGSQHSDHRTLCRAPEHLGCEPRSSDGSPPSRRADHADHNDQATQSNSR